MKKLVLVFLKFPEPGRVKTRLAEGLGEVGAAEAYSQLVGRVFEVLEEVSGAEIRVLYDPPERQQEVVGWIEGLVGLQVREGLNFVAQAPGDLGERLEGAFEGAFGDGYGQVAAIGTDCVDLSAATFEATWERLAVAEVVFGPSRDGGYYLVGLKGPRAEIFREIPWSSEETLEASLAAAEAAGMDVALLEELRDVDTIEDWHEVEGQL
jgi:rSAM/selenodomain-associated transferase 1